MDTIHFRKNNMNAEDAIGLIMGVNGKLVNDGIEGCTIDVIVHLPGEGCAKLKEEMHERKQREKNLLKDTFSHEAPDCVIPEALFASYDKSIEDADVIEYLIHP